MAVIIAYTPMKSFAVLQHDRYLCARINQGFQIGGFGTRVLRMHKVLSFRIIAGSFSCMSSSKAMPFGESHKEATLPSQLMFGRLWLPAAHCS